MTRFNVDPAVLRATVGTQEVVFSPDTAMYYVAEGSGPRVLSALSEGKTLDEAITELVAATGAPVDQVRPDVERFVADLEAAGLVTRAD